ncbi:protein EseG [Burkholderia stabilis]|uniref:Protein EseG n=1 Tax=Burkholderia stabilis TaxID=95485 RepID=A0A4Q2A7Q8_9BURK|nr:protein EseG [Burkholderia stabilis]RXV65277.1 protein EseG [Burkholderia stabilis]
MLSIAHMKGSLPINSTETITAPASSRGVVSPCEISGIAPPRRDSDIASPTLSNTVEQARKSHDKAMALGVDTARRKFMVQALALAAASVGLGAAIAATVLSGGAGVPLLALAGLAFSLASADTACALYEWRSRAAGGEGLSMAGDSLANVIYVVGKRCHASNEHAKKIASYGSIGLRGALTVSTLFTAFFAPSPSVGTAVSALSTLVRPTLVEANRATGSSVAFNHTEQQQRLDAEHSEEIERSAIAQNGALKQQHDELVKTLENEVDMLKAKIESARTRLAGALRLQHSFSTV